MPDTEKTEIRIPVKDMESLLAALDRVVEGNLSLRLDEKFEEPMLMEL